MEKVLLAVGFRQLEDYIQQKLKAEFKFVGVTVYREGIIRSIGQTTPNTVVIRETLEGKENILSIVYEIRTKFPKVRVIFVAGKREPGDALLATLASYGVYDILYGEKIPTNEIIRLLRHPNEYKDIQHLLPKPVLDERNNKVLFESPNIQTVEIEVVKEVVKEVYIDNGNESEDPNLAKETVPQPIITPPATTVVVPKEVQIPEPVVITKENPKPVEENPTLVEPKPEPKAEPKVTHEPKKQQEESKGGLFNKFFGGRGERQIQETLSGAGKQKIISFMGSKTGVGNTSVALNLAVQLAQKKNRVIFIELNDRTPAVNYWYELGQATDGIDTALKAIEQNNFEKINKAIISTAVMMEKDSDLKKNYKKFPEKLDFMFFSNHYLTRRESDDIHVDLSLTKDMYLYLLFQMGYDYIILDVASDLSNEATMNSLVYSNKTVITVTQDVSAIGNAVYMLNELSKNGIQLAKKLHFIINRYEKAELDVKEVMEWIGVEDLLTLPCFNKEFIDANFVGLPVTVYTKNSQIKQAFQRIEKTIL